MSRGQGRSGGGELVRRASSRGVRRAGSLLVTIVVGGFVLAACSSSHSSSTVQSSSSSRSREVPASTLTKLASEVKAAEAVPTWTAPGPSVSASSVRGASILAMPVNSEIGACNTQAQDFAALGSELGAHVTVFSDSGQPSQWETGIEDATAAHDAAIVMFCGIVPGAVAPQLQAAERAGIEVVDGNYNEVSNYQYLDGETAVDVAGGMRDDVADALVNLHGTPLQAIVVSSNSIVQGPAAQQAVDQAVADDCPSSCSVLQTIVVPIQDWATQVESDLDAALVAHPTANAVIVTFDGMVQFALPAVEQAHRTGLEIYTWGGSDSVEKLMTQPSSLVAADPGPDEQWDAYEAMDQVIRLLGHHPAASVAKEVDPNRFWVPANVAAFFGPGGGYGNGGYGGNTFIRDFDRLWQVSGASS